MQEAGELAATTAKLLNVSEFSSVDEATSALVSSLQAFTTEGQDVGRRAEEIVDILNHIGNRYPVATNELAEGLATSGAALVAANNSIEEQVALLSAGNATMQDVSTVAAGLKIVAARLRGTTTDIDDDADSAITNVSKLQSKIKALTAEANGGEGIDIINEQGEYKSTYEILTEISKIFDKMDDVSSASLLELIAGKNRSSVVAAILQNGEILEKAYADAFKADSSSQKELDTYLSSIQGRIDLFNNSVQTMWMNLIDSNVVKSIVDIGTFLVKQLDTLHGKIILIGTALAGLKIHDIMKTTGKGFTTVFNELFDVVVEKIKNLPNMFKSIVPATQNVIKSIKLIVAATDGATKADIGRAAASAGVSNQLTRQIIAEAGLKGVTTALTAEQIKGTAVILTEKFALGELTAAQYLTMMSTMGLKTALQGLYTVLKLNPLYALAAIIAGAALAFDKFTTTAQEAADTAKKAFDEIQNVVDSTKSTIQELETELSTLNDRIEELDGKELSFADNEELEKLKAQREELEHSLKVQEQLLELQQDAGNKQAIASMKAYTKAASEGADETQETAKTWGTISGVVAGIAVAAGIIAAIPTGGLSLGATAAGVGAMGIAGGVAGNKLGEAVGPGIASNEGTYDSWYKTYTKALDAARKDEQEALKKYEKDSSNIDKLDKWQEAQQRTAEIEKEMYDHLSQMQQYMNSLEYGVSDEIDAELDTWNNFLDKFSIDQGASGAEVTALDRIFGENASDEIQTIKEQILEAVKTGKDFDFTSAINGTQELKDTLDYVGLSAEDVKNYFTQIGEVASNVSVKEITPVATYSDLLEDAEAYKEILLQTSEIIVDNTKVTADYKDGLIALVGSEAEVNKYFDKTNKLVVKDAKGLNALVQATKKNVAANASLAKSQARLQYYQLFKKMQACVSAKGVMFNATKSEVLALYQEMNALEKTIAQYSRLEAQLLDTGNAYDQFEKAQEIDSATDYMSSVESWITALHEGFSDGKLGTEAVQVAVEGLIHESVIEGLTTAEEKMAAIHHYATQGKLAEYFDIQFNEDGTLESAEMKLGNMRKFIEDGLANGAFVGSDWMHFDLSDDIDSIEDLADKYQLTKEIIFAAIEEIEDHDIEWLNGDYSSIFEDILPDNLANDIYENTSALADLAAQLANGEITAEQYTAKWSELNKVSQENAQKARENASAWIETSNDLELAQSKVQKLSNELEALQQQGASETDIRLKTVELDIAKQDLSNIAEKLSALETMDPVVLQVAMEQAQEEINDFKENNETLLTKVDIEQDDKTGEFEYKAKVVLSDNEKKKLEEYIQDLNDEYLFRTTLGEEPLTAEEHLSSIESITQNILDVVSGNKNKTTNTTGDTEENISKLSEQIKAAGDLYNQLTNGNVDYNKRPMVSPETMRQYYPEFDGDIATTYSQYHTIGEGEDLYTIDITPILEDGTVLSQDALDEYVNNLVTTNGMDGLLESDTSKLIINAQPGDYDEEYWSDYQEKLGEVKDIHWDLVQQLQNAKLQTNVEDLQPKMPEDGGSFNFKEFFTATIPEKWDEFWNNVGTFLGGLGEEANALKERLVGFFTETVPEKWDEFWNGVSEFFAPLVEQANVLKEKTVNFFTNTIPEKWDEFLAKAAEVWNNVQTWADATKEKVVHFFTVTIPEKWGQFWDKTGEVWNNVQEWADTTKNTVVHFFTEVMPEKWNQFWNIVDGFFTENLPYAIGYVAGAVARFFTVTIPEKWDEFLDAAGEAWDNTKEWAAIVKDKVVDFFTNTIPEKWDEFCDSIDKFIDESIKPALSSIANTIKTFFRETIPTKWREFCAEVGEVWGNITEWADSTKEIITTFFTQTVPDAWSRFWSTVGAFIDENIVPALNAVGNAIKTFFVETIPTKWNAFWTNVGNFIAETIVPALQEVKAKVSEFLLTTVPQKWNEFWNGVGTFLTNTVPQAIENLKTGITTFFTVTVPSAVNSLWNGLTSWISQKASEFWSNLTSGWSAGKSGGSYGAQRVNGTAHARGTAHQSGNWGLPKSERNSLVGELGPEMVVDPSSGRYYTVGDTGAEMVDLPKGAIIFNHKQTESLLNNGYVTSRGKAYAEGNAHVTIWPNASSKPQWEGTGYDSWYDPTWDPSDAFSNAADDLSDAADSMSDAADDSEQVVDFIEMKLEEIEAIIEKTSARIANFLDDTTSINSKDELYDELIKAEKDKADVYLKAAQKYDVQAAAALSGVPQQYQAMARNGAIAIEEFLGEDQVEIAEKIQKYRDWVTKADEAENGHLEAIAAISAHRVEQLEDIATDFENIVSISKSHSDLLQAEMDFIEESGNRLSESYYEELKKHSQKQLNDMQNERVALQKILDDSVAAGDVLIGSDDWYSMLETIYEVDQEIIDCKTSLEEFQNAINDLYWDNFDKLIAEIDAIDSELSNLFNLISDNDKIVDDMGNWTADGYTALGLLVQQMEVAQQKSKEYGDAISKLKKDYKDGLYSTDEYNEKLAELTDGQYDAIKSYEDAKDAIISLNKTRVDAVKDGIQKEIDARSELIEKKKEELSADKDARDFERSVEDNNKSISDVERKIASLKGNTSSSAIAERRRLEEELRKLQQEREDLFYNESVENQQKALDKELENFQDAKNKEIEDLEEYLKNQEKVLQDSFAIVQENTQQIAGKLVEIAEDYGVTISDTVATPWVKGANAIGTYEEQLNTSVSATTKNLEALKQQLKDLETQADKTANSVINATHSSVVETNDGHQTSIKGYATGSKSIEYDQWALIDELGDELQLVPNKAGRLDYIKKGTGILNNTLTERLMDLAMDPTSMLENSKPVVGAPGIITTNNTFTIDASVGTLLHVEHLDGSNPAEVTKLVDKAWEKKMQTLNNSIKKFTR